MNNQTITISIKDYNELIGIKAKYELMTKFRKTDKVIATKSTEEDYQKLIKEQGKALYKLNQIIREKISEIKRLRHEMGHLRNVNKVKVTEKLSIKEMYDFKNIVISALRYSLGRRTYITVETAEFIKKHPKVVDERTKKIMLKDLENYFSKRDVFYRDDRCDYETWLDLKEWLEKVEV